MAIEPDNNIEVDLFPLDSIPLQRGQRGDVMERLWPAMVKFRTARAELAAIVEEIKQDPNAIEALGILGEFFGTVEGLGLTPSKKLRSAPTPQSAPEPVAQDDRGRPLRNVAEMGNVLANLIPEDEQFFPFVEQLEAFVARWENSTPYAQWKEQAWEELAIIVNSNLPDPHNLQPWQKDLVTTFAAPPQTS